MNSAKSRKTATLRGINMSDFDLELCMKEHGGKCIFVVPNGPELMARIVCDNFRGIDSMSLIVLIQDGTQREDTVLRCTLKGDSDSGASFEGHLKNTVEQYTGFFVVLRIQPENVVIFETLRDMESLDDYVRNNSPCTLVALRQVNVKSGEGLDMLHTKEIILCDEEK